MDVRQDAGEPEGSPAPAAGATPMARREKDGRLARSKAAKPKWQEVRDKATGRVLYYRAQPVDPRTGRRVSLRADTVGQMAAMLENLETIRRKMRAGLLTQEEAAAEAIRARGRWSVADAWREYASSAVGTGGTKGEAWRSKLPGIWESHWKWLLEGKTCAELTDDLLLRWEEAQRKREWMPGRRYSEKTLLGAWTALSAAIRLAIARERIERTPWRTYKFRVRSKLGGERAKVSSLENLERLVLAASERDRELEVFGQLPDLTMRLVCMVALALRRGEGIALRWDRVDLNACVVHLREQAREGWRGRVPVGATGAAPADPMKTDRSQRSVRFSPGGLIDKAFRAQLQLLRARGLYREGGPVFPTRDGQHRARDFIKPADVRALAQRAGVPMVGTWVQHSLRHSGAAVAVTMGANLRDVMSLTGHTQQRTVQGYFEDSGAHAVASPLGALGGRTAAALPELTEEEDAPRLVGDVTASWFDARERLTSGLAAARLDRASASATLGHVTRKHRGEIDLEPIALRVARAGEEDGRRPPEVGAWIRARYSRAYNDKRRAGEPLDACRRAGKMASRAGKGGWGRALKAAREVVATERAERAERLAAAGGAFGEGGRLGAHGHHTALAGEIDDAADAAEGEQEEGQDGDHEPGAGPADPGLEDPPQKRQLRGRRR